MGCDIHCTMLRKTSKGLVPVKAAGFYEDSEPYTYQVIGQGRDYRLFTLLSGVRGDESDELGISVHGVPEGVSPEYAEDYYDHIEAAGYGDYHSHTWFELSELEKFRGSNSYDYTPYNGVAVTYYPIDEFLDNISIARDKYLPGVPAEEIVIVVFYDN